MAAIRLGVVHEFDAERGLGTVASDGEVWTFHCTAIADGSRHIDTGVPVAFLVVPSLGGALEAREVRKLAPMAPVPPSAGS
jgi:cold shock CspA family protein